MPALSDQQAAAFERVLEKGDIGLAKDVWKAVMGDSKATHQAGGSRSTQGPQDSRTHRAHRTHRTQGTRQGPEGSQGTRQGTEGSQGFQGSQGSQASDGGPEHKPDLDPAQQVREQVEYYFSERLDQRLQTWWWPKAVRTFERFFDRNMLIS